LKTLKKMVKKTVIKEKPIAELTLRKYEKPYKLNDRELVRKLCLSIGLLQPGDSRDVVVDVLYVLLKGKTNMNSEDVRSMVVNLRKGKKLPLIGITSSNIRRQLKRLRDMFLIERVANSYRIIENLEFNDVLSEKLEKVMLSSVLDRVREYFKAVEENFK